MKSATLAPVGTVLGVDEVTGLPIALGKLGKLGKLGALGAGG
jgi:hypothetical protein